MRCETLDLKVRLFRAGAVEQTGAGKIHWRGPDKETSMVDRARWALNRARRDHPSQ
jgi:hypothetical protein